MKISKFFSYQEVIASQSADRAGIDNSLQIPKLWEVVKKTANKLDEVRELLAKPIIVTSWYRCLELNRLIRSNDTSQHVKGEAVDFICPQYGSPQQIAGAIIDSDIVFDQLILEFPLSPTSGWIHISFVDENNRGQCLVIDKNGTRSL